MTDRPSARTLAPSPSDRLWLCISHTVFLGRWLRNETLLDMESNCIENTKNRIW